MAVAGANYVKCGFAGLDPKAAAYLGRNLVRTVKEWRPECKVYPAVFPEEEFAISFDPLTDGPKLVEQIDCDGLLIDTYHKGIGKGLLDYYSIEEVREFVEAIQAQHKEAWIAGSIACEEMPGLWATGVDVICVRSAACTPTTPTAPRFGSVSPSLVAALLPPG